MPHPGWLPNKLIELELPGRGRVQTRIIGIDRKKLVLLAPSVDGKTVWPNPGSPTSLVIAGQKEDAVISGTIIERKLKPFPLLYLALDNDIPFSSAISERPKKVIAVASGKGGTGKSFFSLNLAWELAAIGHQTLLIDLDLGTANICTSLGLHPTFDLSAVISGTKEYHDVIYPVSTELAIIPGAARNKDFADLSPWQLQRLAAGLGQLEAEWDYLILDTGAGLSPNTTTFLYCADYVLLVINDTPTSVIDGYGLVKAIASQFWIPRSGVVVNRSTNENEAVECAQRFIRTAKDFLGTNMDFLGSIPEDSSALQSLKANRPAVAMFPSSPASSAVKTIGNRLHEQLERPERTSLRFASPNL